MEKARFLSTQARESGQTTISTSELGFNYRMSNVTAGIRQRTAIHLEETQGAEKRNSTSPIRRHFRILSELELNPMNPEGDGNCWLNLHDHCSGMQSDPDMLMDALEEENMESRPIWKTHAFTACFLFLFRSFPTRKAGSAQERIFFQRGFVPSQ